MLAHPTSKMTIIAVMNRGLIRWAVLLLGVVIAHPASAPAQAPAAEPLHFIRFVDRGSQGGELDTADVAYSNGQGVTVHLVAAVHVGERQYYEQLAKSFEGYDAVLYELIKSKDAPAPAGNGAGERSTSTISRIQQLMKRMLNLEFQLDVIDYTKPNFVHADLDTESFQKMEADRGESLFTLMLQQMANAWSQPAPGNEPDMQDQLQDMIRLLCRPDGQRQFKLVVARQMGDIEEAVAGLGGPNGSVILTERNKAAIAVLAQTEAAGKKNIAIFYGAAHMPDMSRRLEAMGFMPQSTQWRMAWDMSIRDDQPSLVEQLLNSLVDSSQPSDDH